MQSTAFILFILIYFQFSPRNDNIVLYSCLFEIDVYQHIALFVLKYLFSRI